MSDNPCLSYIYYTEFNDVQSHGMQVIHTCNELQKHGVDVTLFSYGDIYQFADYHNIPIDFSVKRTPIRTGNKYFDRFSYYTYALFSSLSSDVIFTRGTWCLKYFSALPVDLPPSVIFECHKCLSGLGKLSPEEERSRLAEADTLITLSDGLKQDIEALGIDVDHIVPDAASRHLIPDDDVSSLRDKYGVAQDKTVLVYTGNLKLWKNDLQLMLDGFSQLREEHEDIRLLIAGGNEKNNAQLQSYADDIGLSDNEVKVFGHVPHQTACELQYLADVGIVPLNADELLSEKYTSPLKIYEYLVNNLSIVASDVASIRSAFEDNPNVFIYSPGDTNSFVTTCETALTEPLADGKPYTYHNRASELREIIQASIQ